MKTYEFTGKNVEKAIDEGLKQLGLSKYDVEIKILESGGLFRKAKVQITVDDAEDESVIETAIENQEKAVKEILEQTRLENQDKVEEIEETVLVEEGVKEPEVQPVATGLPNPESSKEIPVEEPAEKKEKSRKYADNKGSKEFLTGLLKYLNIDGTVEIEEGETHTKAIINTDKAGILIGHKGEALSAIQYLANIVEQRKNKYAKRLIVDANDYRDRRDDSLKDLADRMARKVIKYKTPVKLRPMNAYDRRIVHTYLQNFKGVTTHSEGKEPHRCLIIEIDKENF